MTLSRRPFASGKFPPTVGVDLDVVVFVVVRIGETLVGRRTIRDFVTFSLSLLFLLLFLGAAATAAPVKFQQFVLFSQNNFGDGSGVRLSFVVDDGDGRVMAKEFFASFPPYFLERPHQTFVPGGRTSLVLARLRLHRSPPGRLRSTTLFPFSSRFGRRRGRRRGSAARSDETIRGVVAQLRQIDRRRGSRDFDGGSGRGAGAGCGGDILALDGCGRGDMLHERGPSVAFGFRIERSFRRRRKRFVFFHFNFWWNLDRGIAQMPDPLNRLVAEQGRKLRLGRGRIGRLPSDRFGKGSPGGGIRFGFHQGRRRDLGAGNGDDGFQLTSQVAQQQMFISRCICDALIVR